MYKIVWNWNLPYKDKTLVSQIRIDRSAFSVSFEEEIISNLIKQSEHIKELISDKEIKLFIRQGEITTLSVKNVISILESIPMKELHIQTDLSADIEWYKTLIKWCKSNKIKLFLTSLLNEKYNYIETFNKKAIELNAELQDEGEQFSVGLKVNDGNKKVVQSEINVADKNSIMYDVRYDKHYQGEKDLTSNTKKSVSVEQTIIGSDGKLYKNHLTEEPYGVLGFTKELQ